MSDDFRQIGEVTVRCHVCGTVWIWPVTTDDDPVVSDDDWEMLEDHFEVCGQ